MASDGSDINRVTEDNKSDTDPYWGLFQLASKMYTEPLCWFELILSVCAWPHLESPGDIICLASLIRRGHHVSHRIQRIIEGPV